LLLNMRTFIRIIGCLILLMGVGTRDNVYGDELTWSASPSVHLLLGGQETLGGGTSALDQHTSAWEGIYEQPQLFGPFGLQIRYLNEGYLGSTQVPWSVPLREPLHYRDAFGVQLNYWSPLVGNCRAGVALGPEIYFDTFASTYRSDYEDRHGFGIQPSIAAQCRLFERWAVELLASRSFDVASFNATSVLLGLSYTPRYAYDAPEHGNDNSRDLTERYLELTAGRSEVDCFHMSDERGSAIWGIYGQEIAAPIGIEVTLLNEDVPRIFERRALSAQLIAQHGFVHDHLQVFVAVGPALSRYRDDVAGSLTTQVNLLLSYGLKIPLNERAALVLRFGRVESSSGRNDTDLLTAGFAINLSSG
jgi:hypothetical protein